MRCVFDAVFRSSLDPCTDRPVADPRVCGDLSQAVPLPLQVQRHHATFFACFLTFAHLFLAAFATAALPVADGTRFFTPTTSRSAEPPGRSHSIRGGGERDGGAIPFATASEGIFRVKSWSIDGDADSGRCSLDLLQWLSGPNFTKDGRPEFENEGTAVRFAVVRDCILFVVGEDE